MASCFLNKQKRKPWFASRFPGKHCCEQKEQRGNCVCFDSDLQVEWRKKRKMLVSYEQGRF